MMNNEWYGMGGWMGGGWLFMLLLTVAFVLLIVWAARSGAGSGQQHMPSDKSDRPTPLEMLDMRFAKGEISEDEYKSMRRTLTGG